MGGGCGQSASVADNDAALRIETPSRGSGRAVGGAILRHLR